MDALKLAELLCARICHDMSGPVGATAAGAELLQDMGGGDGEIVGMVAAGAAGGAARLKFLRAALGPAAANPASLPTLRALVENHLAAQSSGGEVVLEWSGFADSLDGGRVRLLLNLVMLGREALPRGGVMTLGLEGGMPFARMRGEPASLPDDLRAALTGAEPSGPRAAQAVFARLSAEEMGAKVLMFADERGLTLQSAAP